MIDSASPNQLAQLDHPERINHRAHQPGAERARADRGHAIPESGQPIRQARYDDIKEINHVR